MAYDDYIKAGKIAGEVRENVRKTDWVGKTVYEICEYVESEIRKRGAKCAFPVNTSINEVAAHYTAEPNDELTRNEIKQAVESFLLELVGQRALYDFLVVCDDTNNTPTRIDRNELYVDIAIEPVKSVEFIYIPLRIKNTGEIAKLGQ